MGFGVKEAIAGRGGVREEWLRGRGVSEFGGKRGW